MQLKETILDKHIMPVVLTKPKKKAVIENIPTEEIEEITAKVIIPQESDSYRTETERKRKEELEKLGAELQEITVKLIAEGKLKPFNRKDIYGDL